ncbi:hypothetical protein ACJIZ3_001211 [Penstemon smallii]|uniref:PB1 domain-containing protein n=1 Tax=Penstemon smallii TaxID=265156 RepID=A0ABD3U5P8_9LAMI
MENYSYNSSYPESGDSSPRSREIEFENPPPWEDNQPPLNYKVKIMCSYGGKIHPRPHDNQLAYVGGETKILAVDRNIKFAHLLSKLIAMCDGDNVSFKYQLPGEDLDALISVTNDDDLEHMMQEYDRLFRVSPKPARLRIFIFPSLSQNPSLNSSARSFGSDEVKSEKERFVEALNSAPIITPPPLSAPAVPQPPPLANNVDLMFGLEKANAMAAVAPPVNRPVDDPVRLDPIQKHIQDLHRLQLEEQQEPIYRRKSDDNQPRGFAGVVPEKISQVAISGGVPYWPEKQFPAGGVFPSNTINNEQPVYMIPPPVSTYHAPIMRPVTGAPTQGYYAVQRMPSDVYRDQHQMYNMIPPSAVQSMAAAPPSLPPQKMTGYSEGFGMVRPATTGGVGVVAETGYAQVAYDGGMGRQVIYTAPGGVMGVPPPVQAQYQAMVSGGALNPEVGGKVVVKASQGSV